MTRRPNPVDPDSIDLGHTPKLVEVPRLTLPDQQRRRPGRPKKLDMPPMPDGVFEGMSGLEREHHDFFVAAFRAEFPALTPTDLIMLHLAALEYINLLRVSAKQIQDGQVITMSRQHPAVQLRAWLESLSVTRRQRKTGRDEPGDDRVESLLSALTGKAV